MENNSLLSVMVSPLYDYVYGVWLPIVYHKVGVKSMELSMYGGAYVSGFAGWESIPDVYLDIEYSSMPLLYNIFLVYASSIFGYGIAVMAGIKYS